MTEPTVRQADGHPSATLVPIMQGDIRGERFMMTVDHNTQSLYVHFEGYVAEYPVAELLEESYAEVWGDTAKPDDIEFDLGEEEDE